MMNKLNGSLPLVCSVMHYSAENECLRQCLRQCFRQCSTAEYLAEGVQQKVYKARLTCHYNYDAASKINTEQLTDRISTGPREVVTARIKEERTHVL